MKKLHYLGVVGLLLAALALTGCGGYWGTGSSTDGQPGQSCCGDDKDLQWSRLTVEILKDPQGGQLINKLTCTFKVTYTWEDQQYWDGEKYNMPEGQFPGQGPGTITLHPYWFNGQKRYDEEKMTFDYKNTGGIYTISIEPEKAGFYFDKTFEADFGWTDIDKDHNLASKPAVCTTP